MVEPETLINTCWFDDYLDMVLKFKFFSIFLFISSVLYLFVKGILSGLCFKIDKFI